MENNNSNNNINNNIHNTINNIQKPVSLIIEEFKDNLATVINESGLHMSLIDMIVKEIYFEVHNQAELISAREKLEYERLCYEEINKQNNETK